MSIIEKATEKLNRQQGTSMLPASSESQAPATAGEEQAWVPALPNPQPQDSARGADLLRGRSQDFSLDLKKLERAGMVTPGTPNTQLVEQIRLIKRPLLMKSMSGGLPNGNLIMVTSAYSGEGKTFLSVNLALSMAMEVDRRVLLVDGDVTKRDLAQLFGTGDELGLLDYLANKDLDLSDVLLRTNIDKLSILPAGMPRTHLAELLASDAMGKLAAELSSRYHDRVVIFDAPPLLADSGASVLAHVMGQIVVAVEAERTPQESVREALALLGHGLDVGLVLNKYRGRSRGRYGYGYYG